MNSSPDFSNDTLSPTRFVFPRYYHLAMQVYAVITVVGGLGVSVALYQALWSTLKSYYSQHGELYFFMMDEVVLWLPLFFLLMLVIGAWMSLLLEFFLPRFVKAAELQNEVRWLKQGESIEIDLQPILPGEVVQGEELLVAEKMAKQTKFKSIWFIGALLLFFSLLLFLLCTWFIQVTPDGIISNSFWAVRAKRIPWSQVERIDFSLDVRRSSKTSEYDPTLSLVFKDGTSAALWSNFHQSTITRDSVERLIVLARQQGVPLRVRSVGLNQAGVDRPPEEKRAVIEYLQQQ